MFRIFKSLDAQGEPSARRDRLGKCRPRRARKDRQVPSALLGLGGGGGPLPAQPAHARRGGPLRPELSDLNSLRPSQPGTRTSAVIGPGTKEPTNARADQTATTTSLPTHSTAAWLPPSPPDWPTAAFWIRWPARSAPSPASSFPTPTPALRAR